jgi:hypothetical protein
MLAQGENAQDDGVTANAIAVTASRRHSPDAGLDLECQTTSSSLPQRHYEFEVRAVADIQHCAQIITKSFRKMQNCMSFATSTVIC